MMRLRAAVALLFQLLLLQVSVLGGGMACAPEWLGMVSRTQPAGHAGHAGHTRGEHAAAVAHGGHRGHAAHAAHAEAAPRAAHDGGHVAAAPADERAPDHGGVPSHCGAATGCAAVAVDAPEVVTAVVEVFHASVRGVRVTLPPSTRPAPEPPPPRA